MELNSKSTFFNIVFDYVKSIS